MINLWIIDLQLYSYYSFCAGVVWQTQSIVHLAQTKKTVTLVTHMNLTFYTPYHTYRIWFFPKT